MDVQADSMVAMCLVNQTDFSDVASSFILFYKMVLLALEIYFHFFLCSVLPFLLHCYLIKLKHRNPRSTISMRCTILIGYWFTMVRYAPCIKIALDPFFLTFYLGSP